MKKISLEELKDKDLYLDDDGKIIVIEKSNGKFVPLIEEKYYYLNYDYKIIEIRYLSDCFDKLILSKDYVFKTKEEAEEYAKYLKALEKYRYKFTTKEMKNISVPKYQLYFYENEIEYIGYGTIHSKMLFKSDADCKEFIKEAGKENIKKFMFDIWE